jgi:hypothetical protein
MYTDLIKNKTQYSLNIPKTFVPSPEEEDYENQFINRYFCQKANDENGFIFEINQDTFNELEHNPYWKTAEMRWRIFGPIEPVYDTNGKLIDKGVKESNTGSITIITSKIKNIRLYLPNPLQFYK